MKWRKLIDERLEEILMVATMAIMVLLILYQVLARNFFGQSLVWGEEVAVFLHIWQIWIGASLGIRYSEHVKISLLTDRLNGKARFTVDLLALLSFFIMAVFLAGVGVQFVVAIFESGQRAPTIDISMGVPYLAIPIAGILMTIRLIQQMHLLFKNREKEVKQS
ncbi:TRAP transporter small permease [Salicibibacter halophilus]|nr:TRAP transporter small permease [Salicibibacter halophilus]